MDTKSLAKSKRAHTQHHSKKSYSVHNQTAGLKSKIPVQSRLPSNSDRYEDEEEEELNLKQQSVEEDAIVVKSKGADYMHLLSEAQVESHSKIDCLSSLDDLLHDEFSRVVGSLISTRGDSILSWMEDDNFLVEEEEDGTSSSNHELGFLSLDLNALAKTLEKVDLHERLYIDADLLPLELCTSQTKVNCDEAVTTTVKKESNRNVVMQVESSVLKAESLEQVSDIPILTGQSEKSSAIEDDLDLLLNSVTASTTTNQNPSVGKSSGFETELDSLLNSPSTMESFEKPLNASEKKNGFDDVLDDLLESTSVSINQESNQTSSSSSSAVGKSKVIEEFDSWLDTI